MSPGNGNGRLGQGDQFPNNTTNTVQDTATLNPTTGWRPRHLRNRDRVGYHVRDCVDRAKPRRSDYGLSPAELDAEARRLLAVYGWTPAEIALVLVDPATVPAPHGWVGQ